MENKKEFVELYLKPLLQNADLYIVNAVYKKSFRGEYVTITYEKGYQKNIDVTADSLSAIVRDVFDKV